MAKTTPQDPFPQFERFDRDTAAARASAAKPTVTMSSGGNFRLSSKLAEMMKPGTAVVFLFDRTQDTWYIQRDDKHGLELREEKSGGLQFNSSGLRYRITETLGDDEKTAGRMQVSEEVVHLAGNELYVLLTSSLVQGRKRQ